MFLNVLAIAFIVELMVGIAIGWALGSFFSGRKNSFEDIWGGESTKGLGLSKSTGSAISSAETKPQLNKADLGPSPEALARSEADLIKTENDTLKEKLAKEQTWRASLEAQVGHYKNEATKALALAKTLEAQVGRYKNEAAKALALAKALEASRAGVNKSNPQVKSS